MKGSLGSNELVIIGEWCSTGFHENDLAVFEAHEGHDCL